MEKFSDMFARSVHYYNNVAEQGGVKLFTMYDIRKMAIFGSELNQFAESFVSHFQILACSFGLAAEANLELLLYN